MTIWQELGIEATVDTGAINDAYAARVSLMRPGEDLNAFLRLRAAHTAALHMAGSASDAELWLENTRLQAKSWTYWIGQREPAAARVLLGTEPMGLTWFTPSEPFLSWKLAEASFHESRFADVIDAERINAIRQILLIRRKRWVRALIVSGNVAFWFALAVTGLYFTPLATMGVIVALGLWYRTSSRVSDIYRTELIFPLIALLWVLVSILYAEAFLPPQIYSD